MTDVFPNRACESGEKAISIDSGIKVSIKAHARAEPMQFEENWPQKTPFCANAICGGVFGSNFLESGACVTLLPLLCCTLQFVIGKLRASV